jgi:hypothetical protein
MKDMSIDPFTCNTIYLHVYLLLYYLYTFPCQMHSWNTAHLILKSNAINQSMLIPLAHSCWHKGRFDLIRTLNWIKMWYFFHVTFDILCSHNDKWHYIHETLTWVTWHAMQTQHTICILCINCWFKYLKSREQIQY